MKGQLQIEPKELQIRRKLAQSGINKPQQFQEIISNLITQRERLQNDLQSLREKVVALQQKQARKEIRPKRKDPKPTNIILNQREQLNRKYEQLKQWQKRSLKAMKSNPTDSQYRAYLDKLFNIEQEIQQQLKRFNDQKATYTKLKKALKVIDKEQEQNSNVREGIERQNHLLKKRIGSLKRIVDRQMVKELDLQNCLLDMRDKQRTSTERQAPIKRQSSRIKVSRQQSRSKQLRPRHKTQAINPDTVSDISSSQDLEVTLQILPGQSLTKDQIYQVEGHLNRLIDKNRSQVAKIQKRIRQNYPNEALQQLRNGSKLTYSKQFEITLQHCKNNLNSFSELCRQKIRYLLEKHSSDSEHESPKEGRYTSTSLAKGLVSGFSKEDNYYSKSKSARRLKNIVKQDKLSDDYAAQDKILYPRTFTQAEMQTEVSEYYDPNPLRRQFAGYLAQNRVNDRNLLGSDKNTSIKNLYIYYTDRGIASIQAVYTLNFQNKTLQGKISLPSQFVSNYCKVHIISTNDEDFIRYFKLRYHFLENRITSVKIVTNRNVKSGWGDHKIKNQQADYDESIEKDYIFDINKDEFPVSIVCSHVQKGPYWYLCGFGVEINDL